MRAPNQLREPSPSRGQQRARSSSASPSGERRQRIVSKVSCEACRLRKAKCVFPDGTTEQIIALQLSLQQPGQIQPLQGHQYCERCVKLDLACTIGTNKRRLRRSQGTAAQTDNTGSAPAAPTPWANMPAPTAPAASTSTPAFSTFSAPSQQGAGTGDSLRLSALVGSSSESPSDTRSPLAQGQQNSVGAGATSSATPGNTKAMITVASADMLARGAAFLRNPFSLLAFCLPRVPGFGANLDAARTRRPGRAVLFDIHGARLTELEQQ